jgi:hypothetical protein
MHIDLWSAVERLSKESTDTAIEVEFAVNITSKKKCFLGIGANDSAIVYNNDVPVFGVAGSRENVYTHHIVALDMSIGTNLIRVVLQKDRPWKTIPEDHLTDEWAANLQLFGSEYRAKVCYRQRVAHPFDTGIVETVGDLRIDNQCSIEREVKVFDMSGTCIANGVSLPDTSIAWDRISHDIEFPVVGYAILDGEIGEPVLLYGSRGIEAALEKLKGRASELRGPWWYRFRYFLSPEISANRDMPWSNWNRRFAIIACKLFQTDKVDTLAKRCPALAVEYGFYSSFLDDTTQYYTYYRSPAVTGPRILVIMVPTAPGRMRPYLELGGEFKNIERTAGLAEANGMDVLWPGGVSPDYGGRVARLEVREALNDYLRKFPVTGADRIYVVGACSAAVTTLGLISDGLKVDGAVLWTPVVRRQRARWARDLPVFPGETLRAEQTDSIFEVLRGCPLLMYWDCDAVGHGDRESSCAFVEQAKAAGCSVDSVWLTPAPSQLLRGPYEAISIQEWMQWMKEFGPSEKQHSPATLHSVWNDAQPKTVKDALLKGFTLSQSAARGLYARTWKTTLTTYRGSAPTFKIGEVEGKTLVDESKLDNQELLRAFVADRKLVTLLPDTGQLQDVTDQLLWGFRLDTRGLGAKVDILSTLGGNQSPPSVDLLVDGSCRAALWRHVKGRWVLVQVWM